MGYAVIGAVFGAIMVASALAWGWSLGLALMIGWLSGSLGVICVVGLMAARMQTSDRVEERTAQG